MTRWLEIFRIEWFEEIPIRIHAGGLDRGGTPAWHAEFAHWLSRTETKAERQGERNPDGRLRMTKAARSLRKVAPRQYEVLYRVMVEGESIAQVTHWLNERSIRGGHPERYREVDALAILQAACHWIDQHY